MKARIINLSRSKKVKLPCRADLRLSLCRQCSKEGNLIKANRLCLMCKRSCLKVIDDDGSWILRGCFNCGFVFDPLAFGEEAAILRGAASKN